MLKISENQAWCHIQGKRCQKCHSQNPCLPLHRDSYMLNDG